MLKVTNLPVPTTESDIRELFSDYKEFIKRVFIEIEGDDNIAYVELRNDEYEKDAIEKLNQRKWRGNYIYVDTFRGTKRLPDDPIKSGDESGKTENKDTENNSP